MNNNAATRTRNGSGGHPHTRHIGLLLFDGVEELDAVGPWEVLAHWTQQYPDDGWTITSLSTLGDSVLAAKGMTFGAQHSFADAPPLDVLVHPGGRGTRPLLINEQHLQWVREQRATTQLMTSVCTGSLVYAAAGLLHDRPATTHWAAVPQLRELDPSIRIDEYARFVDDGDIITSAGVSAGIDMALHLVDRLVSAERAREVQLGIQYDHGSYKLT